MFAASLLILGLAVPAQAGPTPAQKCEAGKNSAAGKYAACLHKAQQRFVSGGGVDTAGRDDAVLECGARYSGKWQGLETRAGQDVCPSEGDEAAIQGFLDACIFSAEDALAGGGLIPDVVTCNSDLLGCDANLAACGIDLSGCNATLGACSGDLATCDGQRATCDSALANCGTDLSGCTTDLSTANASLATCEGDFADCGADLADCGADLSATNADLATCDDDRTACEGDLAACQAQAGGQVHETGQVSCYGLYGTFEACPGTEQDGDYQKGVANGFVDNGDGTITDLQTGLMWEKLDDNNTGGIHDWDDTYTWGFAFVTKIDTLNSTSFAGHDDWRLPNRKELDSLANFGMVDPAIFEEFHGACAPGCVATACACTKSDLYWTSTSQLVGPFNAWYVNFFDGSSSGYTKTDVAYVRAVRGGA